MAKMQPSAKPLGPAEYEGLYEEVTARTRIVDLLRRLSSNHLFIQVILPDSKEHYASTVLELDEKAGHLLLDELNPEEGHELVQVGGEMRIRARLDGAQLNFSTVVEGTGQHEGIALYRVRLPRSLKYMQRRKSYRVHVDRLVNMPVELGKGNNSLQCNLHDISAHGISIWLPAGQNRPAYQRLEQIPNCVVHLPGNESINCIIEVRSLRHDPVEDRYILGARFITPEARFRQRISRLVVATERYLIRRRDPERA